MEGKDVWLMGSSAPGSMLVDECSPCVLSPLPPPRRNQKVWVIVFLGLGSEFVTQ